MVYHLQCGDQRVVFQRSPEDTELNGFLIGQIDTGVSAAVAFFDVLLHLLRIILIAITGSPAIQLPLGSAAEPEQFVSVLLHKVQRSGNGAVLSLPGKPEGIPAYMDMEAAGVGTMGKIPHLNRLVQNRLPRHLMQVPVKTHGMCDNFKTIIQTAIVLAVNQLLLTVPDKQELSGAV